MASFAPTQQQLDIDSAAGDGLAVILVKAFAGTGKTSTLKYVTENALSNASCLYLAFNKAIATEAKSKFPRNVEARTAHSLAYRNMKKSFIRNREFGGPMLIVHSIQDDPALKPLYPLANEDPRLAAFAVVKSIVRWCQSDAPHVMREHLPPALTAGIKDKRERAAAETTTVDVARKIWERIADKKSNMPITHDFYLKAFALTEPDLPYDVVLFDEAQDANPVLLGMVRPHTGMQVYVGDSHQQIYSFRGAIDAMKQIKGESLPLTKSWRFGPEIADMANVLLHMLGEKLPLEGGGPTGMVFDHPYDIASSGNSSEVEFQKEMELHRDDAVLCRGNAGVIYETLGFLDDRKRVAVVGGTQEAVSVLYAIYDLWCERKPKHPEIALFKDWQEFSEYAGGDDGGAYRPMVRLVEDHRGGVPTLCQKLKYETVDERDAEVVVSTAHKAKGREWDSVRFADDFPPLVEVDEDENGKSIHFNREEANLLYVSTTRAMRRLNMNGIAARTRQEAATLGGHAKPREDEEGLF